MKWLRMQRKYIVFSCALLFIIFTVSSGLVAGQSTGSWTASSSGVIYYPSNPGNATKKIQIDFTGAQIAYSGNGGSFSGDGFTGLAAYLGGNGGMNNGYAVIDSSMGYNSPPCLKMYDLTGAFTSCEFSIHNMETVVGNEVYYSGWYYLPSNWTTGSTSTWYSIGDIMFGNSGNGYEPMIEFGVHQGDGGASPPISTNPNNFVVNVWGDDINSQQFRLLNSNGTWAQYEFTPSTFPRGRWFNIQWWMRRDPTPGHSFVEFWFDGVKIVNQTAFPYQTGPLNRWTRDTSGLNNGWTYPGDPAYTDLENLNTPSYYSVFLKDYHGGTPYIHQVWVDDLEVWDGKP